MWRSRVFRHLFGSYVLLLLVSIGVLGVVVANRVENDQLHHIEDDLRAKAILVEKLVQGKSKEEMPQVQASLRAMNERTQARITLIDAGGRVLADSGQDDLKAM